MKERFNNAGFEISRYDGKFVGICAPTCDVTIFDDHVSVCGKFLVTGRTIQEYIDSYAISKDFRTSLLSRQVIEVGPGLAEFLPEFSTVSPIRPIAIDPFDYKTFIGMAELALQENLPQQRRNDLQTYLNRARIIADPSKVRLYNTTLKEAYNTHSELHGVADVVIDLMGARTNSGLYDNPKSLETYGLTKQPARAHAYGSTHEDIYPWYKEITGEFCERVPSQLHLDLE